MACNDFSFFMYYHNLSQWIQRRKKPVHQHRKIQSHHFSSNMSDYSSWNNQTFFDCWKNLTNQRDLILFWKLKKSEIQSKVSSHPSDKVSEIHSATFDAHWPTDGPHFPKVTSLCGFRLWSSLCSQDKHTHTRTVPEHTIVTWLKII